MPGSLPQAPTRVAGVKAEPPEGLRFRSLWRLPAAHSSIAADLFGKEVIQTVPAAHACRDNRIGVETVLCRAGEGVAVPPGAVGCERAARLRRWSTGSLRGILPGCLLPRGGLAVAAAHSRPRLGHHLGRGLRDLPRPGAPAPVAPVHPVQR